MDLMFRLSTKAEKESFKFVDHQCLNGWSLSQHKLRVGFHSSQRSIISKKEIGCWSLAFTDTFFLLIILTLYNLTFVFVLSKLFSLHFLWY